MFIDSFQEKIWQDKYQYDDETFEGFCDRISNNVFGEEEIEYREELKKQLMEFRVLFGGRINSNIGLSEEGLTLFNCYIASTRNKDMDSLEGIIDLAKDFALTLKSEGGIGFCANFLRPRHTLIRKIGVTTPGSIKFLEIYDKISEVITAGSVVVDDSFQGAPTKKSIRKGATMVTMNICHPDIEEFITAKAVPNRLTKMNMSVLVTDAFMYAVKEDLDWDLWFPDISFDKYEDEWDGSFEKWAEKGYPTVTYKVLKARELWDLLMRSTWSRNEPGVLFVDTMRRYNNVHYLKDCEVNATNPCAEVFAATGMIEYGGKKIKVGDVCNLGSVNVVKFYDMDTKEFDYEGFSRSTKLMARALDNIIDISNYPLQQYEDAAKLRRKIGVGLTGIGSLLMMMDVRYGSDDSLVFIEKMLKVFMNSLYKESAVMAKEKGPFAVYSDEMLSAGYVSLGILDEEVIDLIKKNGLRNCALSAVAPNGTLSILAGNVSGGIEPVFSKEFYRWNRVEGAKVDFKYPDVHKGEWFETDYLKETTINGEKVLKSVDGNYRVDANLGLCKQVLIQDYGYKLATERGFSNTYGAMELSVGEHVKVLSLCSKFIDLSVSKTINLPADCSLDEFKKVYSTLYDCSVKGCTTYREGTSVAVLEAQKKETTKSIKVQQKEFLAAFKDQENGDVIFDNVKLPDQYPAQGYILKADGGRKWYVHVAFKDKACTRPFAIFVNTNNREDNVLTFDALEKLEDIAIAEGLKKDFIEETKRKYAYQKNPVKICRMLGLLLRHNVEIYKIVKGFDELGGAIPGTFVFRMKKFLAQFVREHVVEGMVCPECGQKTIRFYEGCFSCTECAYSRCG